MGVSCTCQIMGELGLNWWLRGCVGYAWSRSIEMGCIDGSGKGRFL